MAQPTQAKRAVQRIVTDASGNMRLIYIDLETLQPIEDISGYRVLNAGQQNVEQVLDISDPDPTPLNPTEVAESGIDTSITNSIGNGVDRVSSNTPRSSGTPNTPTGMSPSRNANVGVSPVGGGSTNLSSTGQIDRRSSTIDFNNANNPNVSRLNESVVSRANNFNTSRVNNTVNETPSGSAVSAARNNTTSNFDNGTRAGFVNNFSNATHRKGTPDLGFIDSFVDVAGNTLGPGTVVTGYSGLGEYGSARHRDHRGVAMDANISKNGQPVGKQAMEDVAMAYAAAHPNAGLGYDLSYMGPNNIHVDQFAAPGQIGRSWGGQGKRANMDQNFAANLDFARATGIGPTPTFDAPTPFGPDDEQSAPTATGDVLGDLGSVAASSIDSMGKQRAGTASAPIDRISNSVTHTSPGVIKTDDGYTTTTKSGASAGIRNNNPGNIRNGNFAKGYGSIGEDYMGFAVFDNMDQGVKAMTGLLFDTQSYANKTVAEAITRYAPPTENNTQGYINSLSKAMGVTPDTKLSDLTPGQRDTMIGAMMNIESGYKGSTKDMKSLSEMHTYSGAPNTRDMDSPSEKSGSRNTFSGSDISGGLQSKDGSFRSGSTGFGPDLGRFGDMTEAVSRSNDSKSSGGFGSGGIGSDRGQDGKGSSGKSDSKGGSSSGFGSGGIGSDRGQDGKGGSKGGSGGKTGRTGKDGTESGPGTGGQQGKGGRNTD